MVGRVGQRNRFLFLGVEFKEDKNKKLGLFQFAILCETMLERRHLDVFYHAVVMSRHVS